MLRLLTSSLLVTLSTASFCGDSAIPYQIKILPDGQPVLGCVRPTCFGWGPDGKAATNTSAFVKINNITDGFVRGWPDSIPTYGPEDPRNNRSQIAVCEPSFSSTNCRATNQWVGGIAPVQRVTTAPLMMRCCSYERLVQSEDHWRTNLVGGQIYVGGEVVDPELERLVRFDYISDISKVLLPNGTFQYEVTVRRMPCADLRGPAANLTSTDSSSAGAARRPESPSAAAQALQSQPHFQPAAQRQPFQQLSFQAQQPQQQFQHAFQPLLPFQQAAYRAPQYAPLPAAPQYNAPPFVHQPTHYNAPQLAPLPAAPHYNAPQFVPQQPALPQYPRARVHVDSSGWTA